MTLNAADQKLFSFFLAVDGTTEHNKFSIPEQFGVPGKFTVIKVMDIGGKQSLNLSFINVTLVI